MRRRVHQAFSNDDDIGRIRGRTMAVRRRSASFGILRCPLELSNGPAPAWHHLQWVRSSPVRVLQNAEHRRMSGVGLMDLP